MMRRSLALALRCGAPRTLTMALLRRPLSNGSKRIHLWNEGQAKLEPPTHSCRGCGWQLQSADSSALGYVPTARVAPPEMGPEDLEPATPLDGRHLLCQRCWRIEHHNEVTVAPPDQGSKLATLRDRPGVIVLLVDLFDVPGSMPPSFTTQVAGVNPIVLVGNKLDLLPVGATEFRLRMWLTRQAEQQGLHPCDVKLISSRTGEGVSELVATVAERSNSLQKDIFLCGRTNVGKSTLLNKMIRMFGGPRKLMVTESPLHGTTLGLIPVPLGHYGRSIFDTPGLLGEHRVRAVLSPQELAIVQPAGGSRIKPVVFRLVPGKSILLGDYARLDYVSGGGHLLFAVFASKRVAAAIVATSIDKQPIERAMVATELTFEESAEHSWKEAWTDVSFSGVGWISITGRAPGQPVKLIAHGLAGVAAPVARAPLMPYEADVHTIKKLGRPVQKHGKVRKPKMDTVVDAEGGGANEDRE